MKKHPPLLAVLSLAVSCSQTGEPQEARYWEVEVRPVVGARPVVPEYEVEFLPMLPADPRSFIVGKFHIRHHAALDLGNEAMTSAIKRKAAHIGGNTIVYPHTGVTEAMVAYVPPEPINLHGGDDEAAEEGAFAAGEDGASPASDSLGDGVFPVEGRRIGSQE